MLFRSIGKGFPDSSFGKESACNARRPGFNSWVGKIHWRRDRLPGPVFLGFACSSAGKEPAHNAGDLGSIPELGRSRGERKGYPFQYSGLKNSMECRGQGSQSPIRLSDFTHSNRKELMKTTKISAIQFFSSSSVCKESASKARDLDSIPGSNSRVVKIPLDQEMATPPVSLPEKSNGKKSLGLGSQELGMTERLKTQDKQLRMK